MANTLMSADTINDFVINNFIPYAWANMWETTEWERIRISDSEVRRSGSFSFIMTIRPNIYERKVSYDKWTQVIGSTNSYQDLPREYYSSFCIEIPLLCGDYIDPEGRSLNSHTKLKDKYVKHLKNNVWKAVERMWGIAQPVTTKNKMFGIHYSRVKSWMNGEDRKKWAFILS